MRALLPWCIVVTTSTRTSNPAIWALAVGVGGGGCSVDTRDDPQPTQTMTSVASSATEPTTVTDADTSGAGGSTAVGVDGTAGENMLLASGLVIVVSSLVMVYLALMLTNERSEANLRTMHRKLRYLADIDVLTRVPNRRHFHELAARVLDAGAPPPCTLMMFDVDHFKRINDLLGHAAGDEALRQVARCVRDSLRTPDVAGRLGGDEFAVLLPGTGVDDAMTVASRMVARLADRQVAPTHAPLSLSFGIVQMHEGETLDDALRRADQALYEAKRQGRSRAVAAFGLEARPVFGESRSLGLTSL